MGEVRVTGAGAEAFLQGLTPNDVTKLRPGQAHYSALLTERGTYVDDLLVYRMSPEEYLVVVNASNAGEGLPVDRRARREARAASRSRTSPTATPCSPSRGRRRWRSCARCASGRGRRRATSTRSSYYRFARGEVDGAPAILSRTGYTGEDGFELYLDPDDAPRIWDRLLGGRRGARPGPRRPRRPGHPAPRAGMALYGHEIDDTTTPWEADLGWTVKLDKGDFVGRDALLAQQEAGIERQLVGFEVEGRGIAREGHRSCSGDEAVGQVTSGTWSPTFEKALGMAYVPVELAEPGTEIEIEVRERRLPARGEAAVLQAAR